MIPKSQHEPSSRTDSKEVRLEFAKRPSKGCVKTLAWNIFSERILLPKCMFGNLRCWTSWPPCPTSRYVRRPLPTSILSACIGSTGIWVHLGAGCHWPCLAAGKTLRVTWLQVYHFSANGCLAHRRDEWFPMDCNFF